MSKYDALWAYVREDGSPSLKWTFAQIQEIAGIPIDHSFLKYNKELADYGYQVGKISMKEQTVMFRAIGVITFSKGGGQRRSKTRRRTQAAGNRLSG